MLGNNKGRVILTVVGFFVVGLTFLYLFKIQKAEGNIKAIGDYVYSREVKIKTGSGDDDYDTIDSYSGFDWEKIKKTMDSNEDRLANEYAKEYNGADWKGFNDINPENKPEGQVWKTSDENGLTIGSDIEIGGKGTVIIENGDLNIDANMSYLTEKSSIGFIVINGNIKIAEGVSTVGAFYASDSIIFN